jgi:hypothetical protein
MSHNLNTEQLSGNKKTGLLANLIKKNAEHKPLPVELPIADIKSSKEESAAKKNVIEAKKTVGKTIKSDKSEKKLNDATKDNQEAKAITEDSKLDEVASVNTSDASDSTEKLSDAPIQIPTINNNNDDEIVKVSTIATERAVDEKDEIKIESAQIINEEKMQTTLSSTHLAIKNAVTQVTSPSYDMDRLSRQHSTFLQKIQAHQKKIDNLLSEADQLQQKRNKLIQRLKLSDQAEAPIEKQTTSVSIENKLYQSKLDVQGIGCDLVVQYAEKIRENIYKDSKAANQLLAPLQTSCELLKTKVEYVNCLEETVGMIAEHKDLKRQENRIQSALNLLQDCLQDFEPIAVEAESETAK